MQVMYNFLSYKRRLSEPLSISIYISGGLYSCRKTLFISLEAFIAVERHVDQLTSVSQCYKVPIKRISLVQSGQCHFIPEIEQHKHGLYTGECLQLAYNQQGRQNMLVKDHYSQGEKIISDAKHLTKLMVFMGDQNKQVINLLSLNIRYKMVISYGMKNKCTDLIMYPLHKYSSAIMAMIVWQLDLQLLVQSVPITTKVVSLNPIHGKVYSIQHYVINLSVTCDRSVVFSGYSSFFHQ